MIKIPLVVLAILQILSFSYLWHSCPFGDSSLYSDHPWFEFFVLLSVDAVSICRSVRMDYRGEMDLCLARCGASPLFVGNSSYPGVILILGLRAAEEFVSAGVECGVLEGGRGWPVHLHEMYFPTVSLETAPEPASVPHGSHPCWQPQWIVHPYVLSHLSAALRFNSIPLVRVVD